VTEAFERWAWTSPLGVRFCDAATGRLICHGLEAWISPAGRSESRRRSVVGPSGVHAFHHVAGVPDAIDSGADPWSSTSQYLVEVTDRTNRFLAFSFVVELPCRGPYRWREAGATGGPAPDWRAPWLLEEAVPLYSTPWRAAETGHVIVRAELRTLARPAKPAAFAVIEARYGDRTIGRTIADAEGRFALLFQCPEADPLSAGAMSGRRWVVELVARYGGKSVGREQLLLGPAVFRQPERKLYDDRAAKRLVRDVTVVYGQETVLPVERSDDHGWLWLKQ
jgi:hypothetical protein